MNPIKDRDKKEKVVTTPDFPNDLPGEKLVLPPKSDNHNNHAEPNENRQPNTPPESQPGQFQDKEPFSKNITTENKS